MRDVVAAWGVDRFAAAHADSDENAPALANAPADAPADDLGDDDVAHMHMLLQFSDVEDDSTDDARL